MKFALSRQFYRCALLIILGVVVGLGLHLCPRGVGVSPVVANIQHPHPPSPSPIKGEGEKTDFLTPFPLSERAGGEREATNLDSISLLVEQAKQRYDAEQFLEAATLLQQAASAFAAQGDVLNQARALSNLSLAYQQLGQWTEAKSAIANSLQLLQTKPERYNSKDHLKILAQALNTEATLQLALGQSEAALTTWQQATATYTQVGDDTGVIRSLINQTQAMRALGLYRRALNTLTQTTQRLQKQPDSPTKTAGLLNLGMTLRLVGDFEQSQQVLQQSLDLAQRLQSPQDIAVALLNLGNLAKTQQDAKAALAFYQQVTTISAPQSIKLQAQLNQLSLLLDEKQWLAAQTLLPQITNSIASLPPSRTTIYAEINLARSLARLQLAVAQNSAAAPAKSIPSTHIPSWSDIAQLLATSVQQSKSLGDKRAEANALGSLGRVYEQTQQWSSAQELTQQALFLAGAINATDIAYRWQWQLGRLLNVQGETQRAIAAYSEAVSTIKSLRNDLVSINPDVQFSFRESVEPIYRELVSLLLKPGNAEPSQQNIIQARDVIESLQLAELENFFQEACLDVKPIQVDRVDPQAAVIYPIILRDRLEVILSLPGQPLRHYATLLPQSEVEQKLEELRQTLVIRSRNLFMPLARDVYNWLIRPAEADIANSKVTTLVFVLDGSLRNIPMAVLHDGKQYLLQKYSLALTPSLQLLTPRPLQREKLKALTAGLTEARQGFSPLENVASELIEIKSKMPSLILLNQEFTSTNLQKKIESASFPIIHIATHGKFSSKAVETFILAWDGPITVNQFDNLLQARNQDGQKAIELLVLSACETASGDNRAALGLAGIAVRAGARSTLATLWSVNDAGTADLMSKFYQELTKNSITKAEALRHAQLSLLQEPAYRHPIYWAPYVLVGNWL